MLVPNEVHTDLKDIEKGLKRGEKWLSRSEHPLEMFYSDILNTMAIDEKYAGLSKADFRELTSFGQLLEKFDKYDVLERRRDLKLYCKLIGIDFEAFRAEVSSTFWKKVEGENLTVIADSAVAGRYHIFGRGLGTYVMVENGKINREVSSYSRIHPQVPAIIRAYEDARDVFCDGKMHALIVEFGATPNGIYCLQPHPGLDFSPADFRVDWPLGKDEVKIPFVRGRTETAEYVTQEISLYGDKRKLQPGEGASQAGFEGLAGIVSRTLPFFIHLKGASQASVPEGGGHNVISYLFKPKISMLMHDLKQVFTWGAESDTQIVASSRSRAGIERAAKNIAGKDIELEFPPEKQSRRAFFAKDDGKTLQHFVLKENGIFYIVRFKSPVENGRADEKATVSYVSDGTTAHLGRVG